MVPLCQVVTGTAGLFIPELETQKKFKNIGGGNQNNKSSYTDVCVHVFVCMCILALLLHVAPVPQEN